MYTVNQLSPGWLPLSSRRSRSNVADHVELAVAVAGVVAVALVVAVAVAIAVAVAVAAARHRSL